MGSDGRSVQRSDCRWHNVVNGASEGQDTQGRGLKGAIWIEGQGSYVVDEDILGLSPMQ